ncbi:hypothetical protein ScalyP_jg6876 [Parmales sp. scaly parma]|nr:hypothetical protein ScalyP_jg6876 [Parmales sp. scaly parma]
MAYSTPRYTAASTSNDSIPTPELPHLDQSTFTPAQPYPSESTNSFAQSQQSQPYPSESTNSFAQSQQSQQSLTPQQKLTKAEADKKKVEEILGRLRQIEFEENAWCYY